MSDLVNLRSFEGIGKENEGNRMKLYNKEIISLCVRKDVKSSCIGAIHQALTNFDLVR